MVKVILDTNFILNCIRNKVDFYEELMLRGDIPIFSKQVILELERIKNGSKALKFREEATLAIKLINSQEHEEIDMPGKYVDVGIRKYCEIHPEVVLGTMDKELKKSVSNRKLVIRNKKKLELQ